MPEFTVDWFSQHIPVWEKEVLPRMGENPAYLEIGSFEGMSLLWMVKQIPHLYALAIDMPVDVRTQERFFSNVGDLAKYRIGPSNMILPTVAKTFDCIYIDGSHWADDVLSDTVLSWPLLKVGGVMIWDDYGWIIEEEERRRPKPAIDAFLTCYRGCYKVIHIGYQFMVEKIATTFHDAEKITV